MTKVNVDKVQIDGKTYVPEDSLSNKTYWLDGEIELSENVFVRTITFAYTGKLVAEDESFIAITDAAWIADSGRWADAMETGKLSEVEPYPSGQNVLISRSSIIEITEWPHSLPREQK